MLYEEFIHIARGIQNCHVNSMQIIQFILDYIAKEGKWNAIIDY